MGLDKRVISNEKLGEIVGPHYRMGERFENARTVGYRVRRTIFWWHCRKPMLKISPILQWDYGGRRIAGKTIAYCNECGECKDITPPDPL